jgi:pimeloyl-ACP methyl ester carboxylesterase
MVRTMNPATANRIVRQVFRGLSVFAAAVVMVLGATGQPAFGQAAPATSKPAAAAPAAAADPATAKPAAPTPAAQPAGAATPATKPATPPAKPATTPKTGAAKAEPKEEPPPEPENFFVRTKDGWNIFCTFYGPKKGVRRGKDVVPIIMLHGWGGQGSEYAPLATVLQSWGFASIVPDLRGHGRSVGVIRRNPRTNEDEDKVVKADDLTVLDMDGMVNDVEALKKVLVEKNNKAELNIEMLAVVGAEVGTIVAMNWAALDWSWPIMPSFKQGQDVKALILLTPQQTYKRMNANAALQHQAIARRLSVMIAVGDQQARDFSEAKRIHSRLERLRPAVEPEERLQKQDLFMIPAPTPLQGTKLLDRALPVGGTIMKFLDLRLLRKTEDYPWTERKNPLGN